MYTLHFHWCNFFLSNGDILYLSSWKKSHATHFAVCLLVNRSSSRAAIFFSLPWLSRSPCHQPCRWVHLLEKANISSIGTPAHLFFILPRTFYSQEWWSLGWLLALYIRSCQHAHHSSKSQVASCLCIRARSSGLPEHRVVHGIVEFCSNICGTWNSVFIIH